MKKYFAAFLLFTVFGSAQAADVLIATTANTWRLQNYLQGSGVVVWNTGSSCATGQLLLRGTYVTQSETNRFWATVTYAKATGKRLFVYYDNATPDCTITSFGLESE